MMDNNFAIAAMHGELDEEKRDSVFKEFRSGVTKILVTMDTWIRGIHIQ